MTKAHLDELRTILHKFLPINKARLDCLVGLIIAVIQSRTVSLPHLSTYFPSKAKISSRQRRIHRFINEVHIDFNLVAHFIMGLFDFKNESIYLTLDRTNWKWGKKDINFLVLGVVHKGAAIPVFWVLLNKRGNSSTRERIALLKRFKDQFPEQQVYGVLGDREFIGDKWLSWLNENGFIYYMRIKKNQITTNSRGLDVDVDGLFYHLRVGEKRNLKGQRKLGKNRVYLSGLRLEDGELLVIASNVENENSIEIYGKRWEIETLFGNMKGRGFHLEDTRITKLNRLKRLFLIPTIAYCWSHKCGEYRRTFQAIKIKKHGRLAMSIFRFGLDMLTSELFNIVYTNKRTILKIIRLLDYNWISGAKL